MAGLDLWPQFVDCDVIGPAVDMANHHTFRRFEDVEFQRFFDGGGSHWTGLERK